MTVLDNRHIQALNATIAYIENQEFTKSSAQKWEDRQALLNEILDQLIDEEQRGTTVVFKHTNKS